MAEDEKAEKAPAINWVQVSAGSLAAVSSAVLLSTLGVAGTLIGAALGSVIASIASSLYSRGISVSSQQVRAQAAALRQVTTARSQLDEAVSAMERGETGAPTRVRAAGDELDEAQQVLEQAQGRTPEEPPLTEDRPQGVVATGWRDRLAALPWKRVMLISGGLFVVAMVAITAFELTAGRPVSTYTGGSDRDRGTTVPGLRDSGPADPEPEPTVEPTDGPTGSPTGTPTDEPAEDPSPSPTDASPGAPTDGPADEPTQAPTAEPTPAEPVEPEADAQAPAVPAVPAAPETPGPAVDPAGLVAPRDHATPVSTPGA